MSWMTSTLTILVSRYAMNAEIQLLRVSVRFVVMLICHLS
jgi:hypothetical protein